MSSRKSFWKATALAIGLAAISPARGPASTAAPAGPPAAQSLAQPADALVSLEQSTAPLEQYFDQAGDQIRFLALLSPT